jgi:hypothetical protein
MTNPPDPIDVERVGEIASKLTKRSLKAIPLLGDSWSGVYTRDLRDGAYSLWWGRDHRFGLLLPPKYLRNGGLAVRLTRLGLAVKAHLQGTNP